MRFLQQPYPYYHRGFSLLTFTALLFVVGYLFEYLMVPFSRDPEEHLFSYPIICLFHIGVAALIYWTFFSVVSFFVSDDDWKVSKELMAISVLLICIGVGEWSIRPLIYADGGNLSIPMLVEEVWHALLFGGLIYLLITVINLNLLVRQHTRDASSLSVAPGSNQDTLIDIQTQNISDDFALDPASLICVRTDGNYLEFFATSDNKTSKAVRRLTLSSLEEQVAGSANLIRTHRSFLINPSFISQIDGNAQGYQLTMNGLDFKVPVSRKYLKAFKEQVR